MKNNNESNSKTSPLADEGDLSPLEKKMGTWFPDLKEPVRIKLLVFLSELLKASKTMPLLVGNQLKMPESTCLADAVNASRLIFPKLLPNHPLVEFGSGNGLPGVVFAVLYPQVMVVTIEKDARKADFCRAVGGLMGLSNYQVKVASLEEVPERSVLNLVTRGTNPLHKALLVTRKSVPKGGRFFQIRGDGWANELASVPSQLFSFWNPNLLGTYKLPDTTLEMAVLMTDKVAD